MIFTESRSSYRKLIIKITFYKSIDLYRAIFQSSRCINLSFFTKVDSTVVKCYDSIQSCLLGCNYFYVGKTKRRLHGRKTEHSKALMVIIRRLLRTMLHKLVTV